MLLLRLKEYFDGYYNRKIIEHGIPDTIIILVEKSIYAKLCKRLFQNKYTHLVAIFLVFLHR